MASNLSSIGFRFSDAETFQARMIELAQRAGERVPCEEGDYSIWRSRTGAEIWFHIVTLGTEDDARDIAGLTPFYEGLGRLDVTVRSRFQRPGDNAFEGALMAELDVPDGMGIPLTFDAVDFAAHTSRELPFQASARIVCFAREVLAFESEAAYAAGNVSPLGEIGLAAKAFIPVGQFTEKEECGETNPESSALFTGYVCEHRRLTNEAGGAEFHWLLVESLGASFDVVADPAIVTGEIVEGGTVQVGGILIGRLLPRDS